MDIVIFHLHDLTLCWGQYTRINEEFVFATYLAAFTPLIGFGKRWEIDRCRI